MFGTAARRHPKGQKSQRIRVFELLEDDRADHLMPAVRLANGSAVMDQWREPEDKAINRREPRSISGYRSFDFVENLFKRGALSYHHLGAARRLKNCYDRGACGMTTGIDRMQSGGGGFTTGGISETKLEALTEFRAAQAAIGPRLFPVIQFVVLDNVPVPDVAKQTKTLAHAAMGRLIAALDRLADFCDERNKRLREETRDPDRRQH